MLTIDGVSHYYGKTAALDNVSLTVSSGVLGLVGVNGAGKTTLLSAGGGALKPTTGRVLLDGDDLYASRTRNAALRRVAIMPQKFSFPAGFRTQDFVCYLGYLRGLSWKAARAATAKVLADVQLADKATVRMAQLSGGMLRRVALAQALIAEPDVLILDEPTTGIDPEQRALVRGLIQQVSTDRAVIMSSHIMEDIEAVADRVAVLHGGAVVFDGTLDGLRARAADRSQPADAESAFLGIIARESKG
ncbi:ABC transporter ATP-binding protein [Actinoplanes sp. URMC 104]|uniref:ABC transporter ATP-binding protein n=1 Tax=Actinoplanes sp. URMC 104 TaxID=3423409 RepID=UPI003F1B0A9F